MAFRGLTVFGRIARSVNVKRCNVSAMSATPHNLEKPDTKPAQYKTEDKIVYLEDPDTFGTLSIREINHSNDIEDEGDIQEEKFLENAPLPSQKLTIRQYADLIKQYLKYKRIKEAVDVLEVKMLKEDRVKPENYIYNILIGACAEVGYTKKAFKLFNDMKRHGLKPTGDTYTCLFQACVNSPWISDGLKNAHNLRQLMIEKDVQPNLTNYNAMIKAFGRCGDLTTAFQIVDEMLQKKIKIRVHTFNHLLHACISDKNGGLRYALIIWRKMLHMREKPNIYSFNLMLKCVRECNLGTKNDLEELIGMINSQMRLIRNNNNTMLQIRSKKTDSVTEVKGNDEDFKQDLQYTSLGDETKTNTNNKLPVADNSDKVSIQFVNKISRPIPTEQRNVPNLLSKVVNLQHVLSLQEVKDPQGKFAIIGGQDDFLKEMEVYGVKPDVKTFTQMLPLLENNTESEEKLLEKMKSLNVHADIDFYNMLIKKRCLRSDYENAFEVRKIIKKEAEHRKKRFSCNKKLMLKVDVVTYNVLAMACSTKSQAEQLLNEMKEEQLKINIHILATLLRQGTAHTKFGYVMNIMNIVKEEKLRVNDVFIKHLENFIDKCANTLKQEQDVDENFLVYLKNNYGKFMNFYHKWLKDVNADEALKPEHPWRQFQESYPDTVQRPDIKITMPKKFYKRNRKYVKYTPHL